MSCSVREAVLPAGRDNVAVNGVAIPRDLIARESQNHPEQSPVKAWLAAARALVVRELLVQEAKRLDLAAAPLADDAGRRETEEEALIRAVIEHEVQVPKPDSQSCKRYYEQNRRRFRSADLYEAAHILISADAADRAAYATARAQAESLLAQLQAEPNGFAAAAQNYSACSSAAEGGHLGQIASGQTTPEFEQALAQLQPGTMTQAPVATRYGFHIIRLDRKIEGRELPFDLVADRIADYLTESVRHRAIAQYIARLASRATIAGVEMPELADYRVN